MMSDHNWIHTILCNQKPRQPLKDVTVRKYKSIDREKLQEDILSSALRQDHTGECEDDCDDLYNQYHNTLTQLLDKHAPPIKKTVRVRTLTPWFTSKIKQAKLERRRLERKWRQACVPTDLDRFKKQRKVVSDMLDTAKSNYFHTKMSDCGKVFIPHNV